MTRASIPLPAAMIALLAVVGCKDDPVLEGPPVVTYRALTSRNAVLNNLEVSYNGRSIA
jgi:hypothetical protein